MAGPTSSGPILNGIPSQLPDTDPEETQEWVESIKAVVDTQGRTRARYLMLQLLAQARAQQVKGVHYFFTT